MLVKYYQYVKIKVIGKSTMNDYPIAFSLNQELIHISDIWKVPLPLSLLITKYTCL